MKRDVCIFSLALAALVLALGQSGSAMTLEEYLASVSQKNQSYLSYEASTAAASDRYEQGNLELSPVLTGGANYLDDKSLSYGTSGTLNHQQVRSYNLGLAKKFSTGTQAAVTGTVQAVNAEGATGATPFALETHTGTVGLTLSQSLYKDFFGRGTRLRLEREAAQRTQEKNSYDLQSKQALIDAEASFWDLVYLQEELQIRKESLDRAKKIEGWVRSRFGNGIGDRADVLNAQGLTAQRELLLLATQDQWVAAKKTAADMIQWPRDQELPTMTANFDAARPLGNFISNSTGAGRVVRLDTYLAVLDAKAKAVSAEESMDKLRPDVTLSGQYKSNGYDTTDTGGVMSPWTDKDHPVAGVGISVSWLLDWETKNAIRNSAKQDALASRLKRDQKMLESETAWNEINRRHGELSKQIQAAAQISLIQAQRATAERDKLSKGRSITSQVIIAEQDAAEAALTLTKLKAQQRKLESQGRLFVKMEDAL